MDIWCSTPLLFIGCPAPFRFNGANGPWTTKSTTKSPSKSISDEISNEISTKTPTKSLPVSLSLCLSPGSARTHASAHPHAHAHAHAAHAHAHAEALVCARARARARACACVRANENRGQRHRETATQVTHTPVDKCPGLLPVSKCVVSTPAPPPRCPYQAQLNSPPHPSTLSCTHRLSPASPAPSLRFHPHPHLTSIDSRFARAGRPDDNVVNPSAAKRLSLRDRWDMARLSPLLEEKGGIHGTGMATPPSSPPSPPARPPPSLSFPCLPAPSQPCSPLPT